MGLGLVSPAAARPTRVNRVHKLHHRHLRRRIHISRMLPTIIPTAREGYTTVLRGRASWYGRRFQGRRTTSGERFNRHEFTCAHKTLPFGTRLRVTNLTTGATVVVRVTDRGPFRHQRIIDLAEVAARPLGIVEAGAATVVAEVVDSSTPLGLAATPENLAVLRASDPNPEAPFTAYLLPEVPAASAALATAPPSPAATEKAAAPRFVVQAGTFIDAQHAQAMQARILTIDPALAADVVTVMVEGRVLNRVVVSQLESWLAAETVRRNLQLWGIAGLVTQLPASQALASAEKPALAVAETLK
ncbi:septal ring lytic transglycosylase RlpA family protein [Hymenobacter sp. BRD128]|nr:septal ring lytic transglycosylase RlpA family protein [Hymenobacter sp. BRD128]